MSDPSSEWFDYMVNHYANTAVEDTRRIAVRAVQAGNISGTQAIVMVRDAIDRFEPKPTPDGPTPAAPINIVPSGLNGMIEDILHDMMHRDAPEIDWSTGLSYKLRNVLYANLKGYVE